MGANIGTVITSVLVGLKISKYAVYFIIIGAFVSMFSKNKKSKYLSQIIFGFGCLFYGLDLMGNNLSMISEIFIAVFLCFTLCWHPSSCRHPLCRSSRGNY